MSRKTSTQSVYHDGAVKAWKTRRRKYSKARMQEVYEKAALTRKRRRAGQRAALTRKRRLAGRKAAETRRRNLQVTAQSVGQPIDQESDKPLVNSTTTD